jgi:hypothetical protein
MSDKLELNTEGLDKLIKALEKKNIKSGRIGVLGSKNNRSDDGESTNAEIGAKHEFGLDGHVQRSFLRMPLVEKYRSRLEDSNAFDEDTQKEVIKAGDIEIWWKKLLTVAETVIAEAFDTGGFGMWKPSNMSLKKNHQTLVETQQLRDSISSEVIKND